MEPYFWFIYDFYYFRFIPFYIYYQYHFNYRQRFMFIQQKKTLPTSRHLLVKSHSVKSNIFLIVVSLNIKLETLNCCLVYFLQFTF